MISARSLRFAVEAITRASRRGRPVVFAKQVDPGNFRLHAELRLGGRRVVAYGMPRALTPDGRPRLDLFAFELEGRAPAPFAVGDVVALTAADE